MIILKNKPTKPRKLENEMLYTPVIQLYWLLSQSDKHSIFYKKERLCRLTKSDY